MMMSVRLGLLIASFLVGLRAAAAAITLDSPCPDLFRYESTDLPGQWTATLKVQSDDDLYGTWIRLIFDEKPTELTVEDNLLEVVDKGPGQYLLKNRELLLKQAEAKSFKINVKYEGDKVPKLVEYRLNARILCPPKKNITPQEFFTGDIDNEDFLNAALSTNAPAEPAASGVEPSELAGCGTAPLAPSITATDEIKSGKAQDGQWPWQASLYIAQGDKETYACGATLISYKHLVTAAHCVTYENSGVAVEPRQLIAYLARPQIHEQRGQKVLIGKITVYPGYDPKNSLMNDVAVVELAAPATVTDYVRPICLKGQPVKPEAAKKQHAVLVGYGINDRKYADLAQLRVKVISGEKCDLKQSFKGLLTDNTICAQFVQDEPICVGDSGSSLASLRDGPKPIWELRGVVVAGVALQDKYVCSPSNNVVLLDISNYLKWIKHVTIS